MADHNEHEEYHTQWSDNLKSRVIADNPRVNHLLTRILDKVEGYDDLLKGMRDNFIHLIAR